MKSPHIYDIYTDKTDKGIVTFIQLENGREIKVNKDGIGVFRYNNKDSPVEEAFVAFISRDFFDIEIENRDIKAWIKSPLGATWEFKNSNVTLKNEDGIIFSGWISDLGGSIEGQAETMHSLIVDTYHSTSKRKPFSPIVYQKILSEYYSRMHLLMRQLFDIYDV